MQIYILRHGIAEAGKPGHPDSERSLTSEGREKLRRVLKRARDGGCEPSLILSSPYRRVLETADEATAALDYRGKIVRTHALEPESSPYMVWDEIRSRPDESAVLLCSHEPLVSSLVAFLLGSPALLVEMKKAAVVRVDCVRLKPDPDGILKWMLTPAVAGDR